jgi:hypothetical protein
MITVTATLALCLCGIDPPKAKETIKELLWSNLVAPTAEQTDLEKKAEKSLKAGMEYVRAGKLAEARDVWEKAHDELRSSKGYDNPRPYMVAADLAYRLMALHGVEGNEKRLEQLKRVGDGNVQDALTRLLLTKNVSDEELKAARPGLIQWRESVVKEVCDAVPKK